MHDYFFLHEDFDLIPGEALTPEGLEASFLDALRTRRGWTEAEAEVLQDGFWLYWSRATELAGKTPHLAPPRIRNIGVAADERVLRPFAQILNVSTWGLFRDDLAGGAAHPEFVAYLLLQGDRMAWTGEVTRAAIDLAPWWLLLDRSDRRAFVDAAEGSRRPDAALYRAIGHAVPWLAELHHEEIRPPRKSRSVRAIPGTGILVPRKLEARPEELLEQCRRGAVTALDEFNAKVAGSAGSTDALTEWLGRDGPPLLVTRGSGDIVWTPDAPADTDPLVRELAGCTASAIAEIQADLECVADRTHRFRSAIADGVVLPAPDPETEQSGYSYLHRDRGLIAYNLDEAGIERRTSPPLPYAREMLGARTLHEWAHLAVEGGLVPRSVDDSRWEGLVGEMAACLDEIIEDAPADIRRATRADLESLESSGRSAGTALAELFQTRLDDYRANLLCLDFWTAAERETYVRQNIRPLRSSYAPEQRLRLLLRYAYEFQYLRLLTMADPHRSFAQTTGFAQDFHVPGILTPEKWETLAETAREICFAFAPDRGKIHPTHA